MAITSKSRPVYLNLFKIRLPLPGIVSILHRVSGLMLFLFGVPLSLYILQLSIAAPESFKAVRAILGLPLVKLVLIGFVWAYLHHLFAGIRYLLIDIHYGVEFPIARQSSWLVLVMSIALTVIIAIRIW